MFYCMGNKEKDTAINLTQTHVISIRGFHCIYVLLFCVSMLYHSKINSINQLRP